MCLDRALCSIANNLICNMTTFRKTVLTFVIKIESIPGVSGVCTGRICAFMLLHFIPLNSDMQRDIVLKNLFFDLFTPFSGSGGGEEGVY